MNALVMPQPGQLNPKKVFQRQGIQISIPIPALSNAENRKYTTTIKINLL